MSNTTQYVTVSEAKAKLSDRARLRQPRCHAMRHGRPAAVVMSYARFEGLLERMEDIADRLSGVRARELDHGLREALGRARFQRLGASQQTS
jgi:PHD/YefM family antitoxin component YafN of YafNO toxin-antitoxin module